MSLELPVGSMLGPLLCSFYITDLNQFLSSFGVTARQYADDTKTHLHGPAVEAAVFLVEKMLQTLAEPLITSHYVLAFESFENFEAFGSLLCCFYLK